MSFDWGSKLLDLAMGSVPAIGKVLPEHWRRRASERLRDFNPFATIAANEDLLRALRLSWIEAALEVDVSVRRAVNFSEWHSDAPEVDRFSEQLRNRLRDLRYQAFDRSSHPGRTPIDELLAYVLLQVPDYVRGAAGPRPGEVLTDGFASLLASITGWPHLEVPALYERVARAGLPLDGDADPRRSFGELVFSAFAEIVKDPTRYPEAGKAFAMAMAGVARELAQATLQGISGLDAKIDSLLREVRALPHTEGGFGANLEQVNVFWNQRWPELEEQLARIDGALDDASKISTIRYTASTELMQQILDAVRAQGQVGTGQNQLAHETLLALARRLTPDEVHDVDRAVKELEFAVGIALQVKAQGQHRNDGGDRFLEDILRQVSELTEAGHLEKGADAIESALETLDREACEQLQQLQRRRAELLEAAIMQAVLLRDLNRVVSAVIARGQLADTVRPAWTDEFVGSIQAFHTFGRDRGVNFALEVGAALAKTQLQSAATASERASALHWLGTTLWELGGRLSSVGRLEEAVAAYRSAAAQFASDQAPREWASAMSNLALAIQTLGSLDGSHSELLEESVSIYRTVLEVQSQATAPLDWATTQSNIGVALAALGEREGGTANLEAAVYAYRAALSERTRERAPLDWATTQNNLGTALLHLGSREAGNARLEESVCVLRASLEVRTRERFPVNWAETQNNLGVALWALAERNGSLWQLEGAAQAFRAALEELTRDRVPVRWAGIQCNLGKVLKELGQREGDLATLEDSLRAYRAALEEYNVARWPEQFAATSEGVRAVEALIERLGGN